MRMRRCAANETKSTYVLQKAESPHLDGIGSAGPVLLSFIESCRNITQKDL